MSQKYSNAQIEVFDLQKTIQENLAPDRPAGHGATELVGWGGIAPVANFIEDVLGIGIDAPHNTITWHITKTERHGLRRTPLGKMRVDVVCEARKQSSDPCQINVTTDAAFELKNRWRSH